ncbi:hypothetical protein ACFS6H_13575 [Terrimonas rubra]|uniref:Uncharacterized protein n=1 Tax=Terrimonas rubra TaxID=1035890 RepID=A0ABW6A5X3_9BACT
MIPDEIRKQLQNIVNGVILQGTTDSCATIRNHLIQSFGASTTIKSEFESRLLIKENEKNFLINYAKRNGVWSESLPPDALYLTRGGEPLVYLSADLKHVLKVNDAIYYATWSEYFTSLVIHNLLFPSTAYQLNGFTYNKEADLCVILQQAYVQGDQASLENIDELLTFNGFKHLKRHDYYNNEFNLLLEDMHDENIIKKEGLLFFIDTVFYITDRT